ncbi:unnamed protein product [Clavelina lepadiformis]|uniref:Uncharacterized protein n=1 Tax=Clavelina lepadiformis TaxID=159417 RepID=A0ABP0GWX5_CLALP
MSSTCLNTLNISKLLGLDDCVTGIVVNLYFLSGVGMSSTGFKMIFHERILSAGIAGPPRKKRYDVVNQRLKSIVENYDSTNIDIKVIFEQLHTTYQKLRKVEELKSDNAADIFHQSAIPK